MFAHRQTPRAGEIYLDHLGWYVSDMQAASTELMRLGFALTPFTEHRQRAPDGETVLSGTANRCAMLERGYLEFLTDVKSVDSPLATELRDGLARYAGLHLIAFTCENAAGEYSRIEAAGIALRPLVHLRRQIVADGGEEITTAFSVIRTKPAQMPEGRIQMLTHETPEAVWQRSLIAADNFVDALTGVVVCSDDPKEAAGRFSRFLGRDPAPGPTGIVFALDRGVVRIAARESFLATFPGAAIPSRPFIGAALLRSRDLAATEAFFAERGVSPLHRFDDALVLDRADGLGAYLVIHADSDQWS